QAQLAIRLRGAVVEELPNFSADLVLQWDNPTSPGTPFDVFTLTRGLPDPDIAFQHIRLNVGSFLNEIVQPVFDKINRYNIIAPIADVLDTEVPIVGQT